MKAEGSEMSDLKPTDLRVGDRVEFYDAIANHRVSGPILKSDNDGSDDGRNTIWDCTRIWIEIEFEDGKPSGRVRQQFHTQYGAETALYWFAGDPESEATPEERGCYALRSL
jgi:hypothetical protein